MTLREILQTGLDVVAANFVADTIKPDKDRQRILLGATAAATGYLAGPTIEEKIGDLGDLSADDITQEDFYYPVVGAAILGLGGYLTKPSETENVRVVAPEQAPQAERPNAIVSGVSFLYLGASLFLSEREQEFTQRQRWGVGAGLLAYLLAPEGIQKTKEYLDPVHENHQTRRAIAGAVVGGTSGALVRVVRR